MADETTKNSIGVACIRFNGNIPEVLMVCKRYTYQFADFVHGKYKSPSAHGPHPLLEMFNKMTIDEKLDIMSLDFERLWYRVWLNSPKTGYYIIAKNKFESLWLIDEGKRLHRLISRSRSSNRIWEIPKGRKKIRNEPDIICAIREFYEETGVPKKAYRFIPGFRRAYSFTDDITYTNSYYIALALNNNLEPSVNFNLYEQINEVSDIKWCNLNTIRMLDPSGILYEFIKPIFKAVKKYKKT